MSHPTYLLVDPAHYEVAYAINPWMQPGSWNADPTGLRQAARSSFTALANAITAAGGGVEILPGSPGAPDLVFPANAAVVLDGKAVLARFRFDERKVEEPIFADAFADLVERGLLEEVHSLPEGVFQEGAGDFIWDASRRLFWAGYGPRSTLAGAHAVAAHFSEEMIALELATEEFYHLDTCFCPLPGGEILFYPPAFTAAALHRIRDLVPASLLIEASPEDAQRFCVNAVGLGRTIIMAEAADSLRDRLTARGYKLVEIALAPFILSGGGAYCMTLRLDRSRAMAPVTSRIEEFVP